LEGCLLRESWQFTRSASYPDYIRKDRPIMTRQSIKSAAHFDFSRVCVLDGAMATELERRGCNISGPLWSAHILDTSPGIIEQVHLDYLRAGADCISTVSYQVSAQGYTELGRPGDDAARALDKSVEIAKAAREQYACESDRPIAIAASLGPYGAALHNGAEFHGRYEIKFEELVAFHAERLSAVAEINADLIALETIPSLDEARAILRALAHFPSLSAWVSFTCKDAEYVAHGEALSKCVGLLNQSSEVVAVGINCTHPGFIMQLVGQARSATHKPVIVYPNSGEKWDARMRQWSGVSDVGEYGRLALSWFEGGAQAVGGCCRTTPAHIRAVRETWEALNATAMRQ
jgi:homocysteine S-methyltransferase